VKGLGKAVRELREAAGMSRPKLAAAAGISEAFLIKIEQGNRGTSPKTLPKLATALGVTAQELVTRAALLEASVAETPQEMRQAALRAAAANPALIASVGLLAVPPFGLAAAALAAYATARRMKATENRNAPHTATITPHEARKLLIAEINAMPDDQVVMIIENAFRQAQEP
jgi:transcriptional regulator with XRE-family HTH domain